MSVFIRAEDKVRKTNFNRHYLCCPNPMFDHLFNKWSNVGFGEELVILEMKIFTLLGALFYSVGSVLSCLQYMSFRSVIKDAFCGTGS